MKKYSYLVIWVIFAGLLLSSCSRETAIESRKRQITDASNMAVTFVDDLGREITVDQPERVAPLLGSFAQVWTLAGGSVCATVDDAWDDLHLELPEETVNLGNTKEFSLELLLSAKPDFIIASTNTRQDMELKDALDATGIPAAYFKISDFEDYLRLLKICTDITGCPELYEEYGIRVRDQIEKVREKSVARLEETKAPTVLSLVASASNVFAKNSEDNVLGEMLKDLGCINIADSEGSLLENLSMEHILIHDPDYIFIVQRGDNEEGMKEHVRQTLMEHPVWSRLTAVQKDQVFFMEKNLYNLKPNHRWGEAYEKLEEILNSN